jgi:neutral amino acid transport system permease protein
LTDRTALRRKPLLRAGLGVVVACALAALLGPGRAGAQEGDDGDQQEQGQQPTTTEAGTGGPILGVGGTLRVAGEPVEDATITVATPAGEEIGEATTDPEGSWQVDVPAAGPYTVTIDPNSLPEDVTVREGGGVRQVQAQVGLVRQVAFPLVGPEGEGDGGAVAPRPAGPSLAERITDRAVDGVKFGLIIAMAAIGLSLIFGTTGLINFAHGELVSFGAIAAWSFNAEGPQLWLVWAALIAVALTALIGGGLELGVWRPLRERGTGLFQMMVISIGISLAFRQALLIWFGSDERRYTNYTVQERLDWGPFSVTPRDLVVMGISVACLVLVALMLQKTRIGKAMRAVSDEVDLAESSGIDVRRVILFVWVLGAALAGLGGILQATTTNVDYLNGFQLLLLMFAAVILGGLGTAYGAMVGGIVVGLATEISTVWLSPELKSVWALAVLIAVLLARPQGILGIRERIA